MPNFHGSYERSVDAKARLILPSRVREQLAEAGGSAVYLSPGNDHCIALYAEPDWDEKAARLQRNATSRTRALIRVLFANTVRVVPDRQGRVPLPANLLRYAGIDVESARDLVLNGAASHFEIWERSRWEAFADEHEPSETLGRFDYIEFERRDDEDGWRDSPSVGGRPGGDAGGAGRG